MATPIPLVGVTAVARTGATVVWSGLGDGLPAFNGGFSPGDTGQYVRFRLVPSSPLPSLPPYLDIEVTASKVEGDTYCDIAADVAALGDSSGPLTASAATGGAITSGVVEYSIPTAGVALADLNAGNVYLFLAYRSDPATNDYSSGWTFGYVPTPPQIVQGNSSGASSVVNFQVTPTKVTTSTYVVINLSAEMRGGGTVIGVNPALWNGTLNASSLGQSGSEAFDSPPPPGGQVSASITYTSKQRVVPNAAVSVPVSAVTSLSFAGTGVVATARADLSGVVVAPDPSTLLLTSVAASYSSGGGVPLASPFAGAFGGCDNSEDRYPGDVVPVFIQSFAYSSGEPRAADSLPVYAVYEGGQSVPVLVGECAEIDPGNATGFYGASFVATPENGFQIGKTYVIRGAAAVDGVPMAGIVEEFVIREPIASSSDYAGAVWGAPLGEVRGRPTTMGGALCLILAAFTNRLNQVGRTTTLYDRGGESVIYTQTHTTTDGGFDRAEAVFPE